MGSQNQSTMPLWKTLSSLASTVRDYQSIVGPDYTGSDLRFAPDHERTNVILLPTTQQQHTISEWALGQMYTHYGVRPKWFSFVDREKQAEELNWRLDQTQAHRFRTLQDPSCDLYVVRGFVSPQYADLADTTVMDALCATFGGEEKAWLLPGSTKTDQCLYAHVMSLNTVGVPTSTGRAYAGVSILNSEVGYTALRVQPVLWTPGGNIVPIATGQLYRRIHRGSFTNLQEGFAGAMKKNEEIMGDIEAMLSALEKVFYAGPDEAAEAAHALVLRARGSVGFALACKSTYATLGHQSHNGMSVVETIASTARTYGKIDDVIFTLSSIAGAAAVWLTA